MYQDKIEIRYWWFTVCPFLESSVGKTQPVEYQNMGAIYKQM